MRIWDDNADADTVITEAFIPGTFNGDIRRTTIKKKSGSEIPQSRRMTKPLKEKGKRPKSQPFWVYDKKSKRRYHPSTWRSMIARGLVLGASAGLGHWLIGMWLPAVFDPVTFVGGALSSIKLFISDIVGD